MNARLRVLALVVGGVVFPSSPSSVAATDHSSVTGCDVTSVSFAVNGETAPLTSARRGDHVVVSFEVPEGCANQMTFASFLAPAPALDGSRLREQVLFSRATGLFGPGRHSMAVDVYDFPTDAPAIAAAGAAQDCSTQLALAPASRLVDAEAMKAALQARMDDTPYVRARMRRAMEAAAANEQGANQSGPYDSTCDGSPSQNGNGAGGAGGRPCTGCVGNADDKNPPGQLPGGGDGNAGYECDRNNGVGQGNPAHSGCNSFQLDFSYSQAPRDGRYTRSKSSGLVAAVFCVRTTPLCYLTDNTA